MHDFWDEAKAVLGAGGCVVAVVAALLICAVIGDVVSTAYNVNVGSSLQRQNLNHDANYQRQVENDYRTTYNDFQSVKTTVTNDKATLAAFEQSHPNLNCSDPNQFTTCQLFQQDQQAVHDDYQAEANLASHYNALSTSADTGPFRPSDLPTSLTADTPTP